MSRGMRASASSLVRTIALSTEKNSNMDGSVVMCGTEASCGMAGPRRVREEQKISPDATYTA